MSPQMWRFLSSMFSAKSVGRSGNKGFGLYNMANLDFGRPKQPAVTLKDGFVQENPPRGTASPVNKRSTQEIDHLGTEEWDKCRTC